MAEESFRTLLGIEEIDVLTEQFLVLAREQERVGELAQKLGGDPNGWSQFAGRLRVALAQFRGIEGQMQAAVPQAPGGSAERLKRLIKEMEKRRAAVEAAFADGEKPTKELLPATLELTKLAGEIRRKLLHTKFDALSHGPRVMNQLLAEVQPNWANFEKLRQDVEQASANDRLSPATRAA